MRRVRQERRLRAKDIDSLPAGIHDDGGGLRLVVEHSGARRWTLRLTITGRRRHRGLGPYPLITLEAARDQAIDARRAARKGEDVARRAAPGTSFRQTFEEHFAHRQKAMSNAKHISQWRTTVEKHAYPVIGDRPIADIGHDEIVDVLEPIWRKTPETARRLLQRLPKRASEPMHGDRR